MFNSFLKSAAVAALVAVCAVPVMASVAAPPLTHQGQWWTHPSGCEYSRAGRPGETVWYLIINTVQPGCPTFIATKTWGSVYSGESRKH